MLWTVKSVLRLLVKLWAILADTLQVIGFDWRSVVAPATVAAGTLLIGAIEGVSWFQLAIGVPLAFAAVTVAATVVRVWPYLGNTPAVRGVPPMVARNLFTDEDLRKRRDESFLKQHYIWGRLHLIQTQLARFNRRRLAAADGTPATKEELTLRDELEELTERKDWADIDSEVAQRNVIADFYAKTTSGRAGRGRPSDANHSRHASRPASSSGVGLPPVRRCT
jgi:hypothetical protein